MDSKPLQIDLEFFAILKDILSEKLTITTPSSMTIKELKKYLTENFPDAKEILKYSRFSTETEILNDNTIIEKNQKLYVLPPSSGG